MSKIAKLNSAFVIAFLLIASITWIHYKTGKEEILQQVESDTSRLLNNFMDETTQFSNERRVELQLMADYIAATDDQDADIRSYLNEKLMTMPYFNSFQYTDQSGIVDQAINKRPDHAEGVVMTTLQVPVSKGSTVKGTLIGTLRLDSILGRVSEDLEIPGTLFIFNEDELIYSTARKALSFNILNRIIGEESGAFLQDRQFARYIMFQKLDNGWTVIADSANVRTKQQIQLSFWGHTLFVFLLFGLFLTTSALLQRNKRREESMLKHDLLTGLPNRSLLEERLQKDLEPQNFKDFAIIFINIDRFKEVNERNGYQLGDRVLFELSRKLQQILGKQGLYRVGGDEFLCLYPSKQDQDLHKLSQKLLELTEEPLHLTEYESIWLTFSIGVRKSDYGDTSELMMQDAVFAIQEAKKYGGNRMVMFSQALADQNERARYIANHIGHALMHEEFQMMYQPVYDVTKKRYTSFEALIRWNSPHIGRVSPSEFIPLLESNDLIIPVGKWVVRTVAKQVKEWQHEGYRDFYIALNISVKQMMHPNFLEDVTGIIKEEGISPCAIMFEVTETVAVQNMDLVIDILARLKSFGVQTALDDFGTGHSSLGVLKRLPISTLKVDRSFIVSLDEEGETSRLLLQGVLQIAKSMGMTTVVEGVETPEQLAIVESMHATKVQGYYFSKPIHKEKAKLFLMKKETTSA